jgi:hypothetical protein
MLSQRLQEFLSNWCNPETEPEYVADVLRGPSGTYYKDWLAQELLTAVQSRELNPESMAALTGVSFDDQQQLDHWLRTVWPMWFPEPYPG